MRHALPAALAASSLLFSACGNLGRAPEDRINAAYPVADAVAQSRTALDKGLKGDESAASKEIDAEMASRLKIRALTCGKGHEPGLFESAEDIRAAIGDPACFANYDRTLAGWLNHRRIALLLSAPPLRSVPDDAPRFITGADAIGIPWFADEAGVILLETQRGLEILDLATSEPIYSEARDSGVPWRSSTRLSPNGRLFLTSRQGGLAIRESESGEVLADYDDVAGFYWLDGRTALVNARKDSHEPQLLDFETGARVPVRGLGETVVKAIAAPARGEFVICTQRSLVRLAVDRKDGEASARIVDESPLGDGRSWSDGNGMYSADHSRYVSSSGQISVNTLDPLGVRTISLESLYVQNALPTPDPDQVLITGYFRNPTGPPRTYVISMRDLTIAPVLGDGESTRYVYIPPLDRIGAISRSRIEILDEIPLGDFQSFEDFAESGRAELQLRQLEALQRGAGTAATIPRGLPVPDWARDAEVEAIGVYEAKGGSHGFGKPSKAGPVAVQVRRSRKAMILVLVSYEPVDWKVTTEPGAQVAAVLLGGYNTSRVSGTDARQLDIGNIYAYEQGGDGYGGLEAAVARRTGKRISNFQGRYSGETFTVGGR